MGGPTNTTPRYRPPPPGTAPPPPPTDPSDNGQPHQQHQQDQQHQQYQQYQHQQQQQPPPARPTVLPSSYASRSVLAHSPHNSQHDGQTVPSVTGTLDSLQAAENAQLLQSALRHVQEASLAMQRAMEAGDLVVLLETASKMLEELGDYHGQTPRATEPLSQANPSFYTMAGGAVPPLANYADRAPHYPGLSDHRKTSLASLSPKHYYELHMRAMDEMPHLEEFLLRLCTTHVPTNIANIGSTPIGYSSVGPTNISTYDLHFSHMSAAAAANMSTGQSQYYYTTQQLYEAVQWCPRVVPRLYLQICVGSMAIRAGEYEAVQVLKELGEAARSVQCPVRGLFLRHYLLMALKDKLPEGKSDETVNETTSPITTCTTGSTLTTAVPSSSTTLTTTATTTNKEKENGFEQDSGPTSPPPALPPPPPPISTVVEESSLLSNTALFPEQPNDLLYQPLFSESVLMEPSPLDTTIATHVISNTLTPLTSDPAIPSSLSHDNHNTPPPSITTSPTTFSDTTAITKEESRKGTVKDSYEFILKNLFEMNRLWIRIQYLPGDKSKETKRRRERERNELRILVGSNLNRLSQLEGISAHTYGSSILPRILDEVATCRDSLAQAYLMDCIIQVFPDEFHIETLEMFLGVLPKLRDKVNVRTIFNNMMERLLHYYQDATMVDGEVDTNHVKRTMALQSLDMFDHCVRCVFEARGLTIPPKDVIRLQGVLLNYALQVAPGNVEYISRCIGQCARELATLQEHKKVSMMGQGIVVGGGTKRSMELDMDDVAITELEKLLSIPLDQLALKVLNMPEFSSLTAFLPWENQRKVATSLLKAVVSGGENSHLQDVAEEEQLFSILAPLLRDEGSVAPGMSSSTYEQESGGIFSRTANLLGTLGISHSVIADSSVPASNSGAAINILREEQTLVAKLIHTLDHHDTDVLYQMLTVARKHIQSGGVRRVSVTMPSLVFATLRLLRRVQQLEFPKSKEELNGMNVEQKNDTDAKPVAEEIECGNTVEKGTNGMIENAMSNEEKRDNESETVEVSPVENSETAVSLDVKEVQAAPLFEAFSKSVNCRKILVFLQKTVALLATNNPEFAFKLYLEIAVSTDLLARSILATYQKASNEFSSIAYDFMTQSFIVYEDEISESKAQIRAITSIVGSLLSCRTFERSDYEALITKTTQYAAKILKKPDQCRMVCLCSRLFYVGEKDSNNAYHNPQRVLECLQRALKIADACSMGSSSNLNLFVEILDYYLYYYEIENPSITDKFVSGLIALINEHLNSISGTGSSAVVEAKAYFGELVKGIKKKQIESDTTERFSLIIC